MLSSPALSVAVVVAVLLASPSPSRSSEKKKARREREKKGNAPNGDATKTSDPKKSTYSRTLAFVTFIPSRKWSSVFPRNTCLWSSGIHIAFFRFFPSPPPPPG
jgi:hypothetical protein